jgi:hypothetical protein
VSSTGNIFPATGESVDRAGLTAWTNPGNVVSDNTTDATCNGAGSDYLVARNFDFSVIPAGAAIAGITVRVEASEHSAGTEALSGQLQDETATLVGSSQPQTISGTGKAVYTYGGTADLWGATLTAAIVKDPDFGVRLWFTTSHDVRIDYVTMAVEYTASQIIDPGISTETDTALATSAHKSVAVGVSAETDAALALTVTKTVVHGFSTETDTAFGTFSSTHEIPIGLAVETDTALQLSATKQLATGLAAQADAALMRTLTKQVAHGFSVETDAALARIVAKQLAPGVSSETDAAFASTATKFATVGIAIEADAALALVIPGSGGEPDTGDDTHNYTLCRRMRDHRWQV